MADVCGMCGEEVADTDILVTTEFEYVENSTSPYCVACWTVLWPAEALKMAWEQLKQSVYTSDEATAHFNASDAAKDMELMISTIGDMCGTFASNAFGGVSPEVASTMRAVKNHFRNETFTNAGITQLKDVTISDAGTHPAGAGAGAGSSGEGDGAGAGSSGEGDGKHEEDEPKDTDTK